MFATEFYWAVKASTPLYVLGILSCVHGEMFQSSMENEGSTLCPQGLFLLQCFKIKKSTLRTNHCYLSWSLYCILQTKLSTSYFSSYDTIALWPITYAVKIFRAKMWRRNILWKYWTQLKTTRHFRWTPRSWKPSARRHRDGPFQDVCHIGDVPSGGLRRRSKWI